MDYSKDIRNPNDLLQTSIDMISAVTSRDDKLKKLFADIVKRISNVIKKTEHDVHPPSSVKSGEKFAIIQEPNKSKTDTLRHYKFEQSAAFDKLIVGKLNRQDLRENNQVGGFIDANTVFGFGKQFAYSGVSAIVGTNQIAWYGMVVLLSTVGLGAAYGLVHSFSSLHRVYKQWTDNKTKNYLKRLARFDTNKIDKFIAVAIIGGETKNDHCIELLNKPLVRDQDLLKVDTYIDKLKVTSKDLDNTEKLKSILLAGYMYAAKGGRIVFTKELFKKVIYMCLGFGVRSEIIAAKESFEIKFVVDSLIADQENIPTIKDFAYGGIISNILLEFALIRHDWFHFMPEQNQINFDVLEKLLSQSRRTLDAELQRRADKTKRWFL